MTEDIKRKFHNFVMVMEEEARLYEAVQKVFETTKDKEEAANIVHEHYAKALEEAMEKSKAAWLAWQETMGKMTKK